MTSSCRGVTVHHSGVQDPDFGVQSGRILGIFLDLVWFNHAFLRLKSRNNTNAARGNTITSKITSWLYGDEKI